MKNEMKKKNGRKTWKKNSLNCNQNTYIHNTNFPMKSEKQNWCSHSMIWACLPS